MRVLWLCVVAVFVVASGARAAGDPGAPPVWRLGGEPLQVDSRTLEAKTDEGLVLFEGEVVARQGELTLQADRVEVRLEPETRAVLSVKARGSVRLQKGDVLAAGDEADYDAATGVVVLTGKPKVWRDRDVVEGDRITLHLAENRSVVEGARAVLFPGTPPGRSAP